MKYSLCIKSSYLNWTIAVPYKANSRINKILLQNNKMLSNVTVLSATFNEVCNKNKLFSRYDELQHLELLGTP